MDACLFIFWHAWLKPGAEGSSWLVRTRSVRLWAVTEASNTSRHEPPYQRSQTCRAFVLRSSVLTCRTSQLPCCQLVARPVVTLQRLHRTLIAKSGDLKRMSLSGAHARTGTRTHGRVHARTRACTHTHTRTYARTQSARVATCGLQHFVRIAHHFKQAIPLLGLRRVGMGSGCVGCVVPAWVSLRAVRKIAYFWGR
jgi:hypothetical protein